MSFIFYLATPLTLNALRLMLLAHANREASARNEEERRFLSGCMVNNKSNEK